jgi:fructokinase
VVFDVNLRGSTIPIGPLSWGLSLSHWQKVNAEELEIVWDLMVWHPQDRVAHRDVLHSGVSVVTRGPDGCTVFSNWEEHDDGGRETARAETFHEPGVPAKVVDTVGAGDAFTAAMVCLHLEGRPLRACARFANHYAARVCEQPGGTPRIDRREVELAAGFHP